MLIRIRWGAYTTYVKEQCGGFISQGRKKGR